MLAGKIASTILADDPTGTDRLPFFDLVAPTVTPPSGSQQAGVSAARLSGSGCSARSMGAFQIRSPCRRPIFSTSGLRNPRNQPTKPRIQPPWRCPFGCQFSFESLPSAPVVAQLFSLGGKSAMVDDMSLTKIKSGHSSGSFCFRSSSTASETLSADTVPSISPEYFTVILYVVFIFTFAA